MFKFHKFCRKQNLEAEINAALEALKNAYDEANTQLE